MRTKPTLHIAHAEENLVVTMPPSGNRWIIGLGLFAGIPWLLLFIGGSIAVAVLAPPELKRNALLGAFAANLLFLLVHILAVAGVWLAFYNMRGSESLIVGPERLTVARTALGMTVPVRLPRTPDAHVTLLDTSLAPGKWPHPRLEARSGRSAMRFGAGLNAEEAERVQSRVAEELEAVLEPTHRV